MLTLGLNLPADSFATCQVVSARRETALRAGPLPYQCFGLLDMLVAEQELAVEVAEVDGVEVYNVDSAKAGENEVLEQFAADAASSYHQDACLHVISDWHMACLRVVRATSLMR